MKNIYNVSLDKKILYNIIELYSRSQKCFMIKVPNKVKSQ